MTMAQLAALARVESEPGETRPRDVGTAADLMALASMPRA